MIVRALMALGVSSAVFVAAPSSAQDMISPYSVLAGKSGSGFSDRTARIVSIMGPELGSGGPLRISARVHPHRALRHDANASAGFR